MSALCCIPIEIWYTVSDLLIGLVLSLNVVVMVMQVLQQTQQQRALDRMKEEVCNGMPPNIHALMMVFDVVFNQKCIIND